MLIPHLGYLIVAIVSALATAYLNIEIPQSLGQIVNVVATFVRTNGNAANESMTNFLNQIREPAKQIVKMYLAQGWKISLFVEWWHWLRGISQLLVDE